MAAEGKDVELRIRARDYSQKTLDQVVEALQGLAKAQDDQLDSAKKGEVSAKALEAAYLRIEDAARALSKQGSLVKTFELQNAALVETTQRLDQLRAAQRTFADGIVAGIEPTKEQTKQLAALARGVAAAEKAQLKATDRVQATADRLGEYGIAATEVAGAQQRIVSAIAQANVALERQDAVLQTLDDSLRERAKRLADKAKAEKDSQRESEKSAAETKRRIELESKWALALRNLKVAQDEAAGADKARAKAKDKLEEAERIELTKKWAIALNGLQKAQYKSVEADKAKAASVEAEKRALQQLGDQLAQTAKGYATIANASSATTTGSSLANNLRDIADPAAAALRNLKGVEQAVDALGTRVKGINGPVKEATTLLSALGNAQKAAVAIAGQVDGYTRQVAALKAARAEYVKARGDVAALVAQLKAGNGGEDVVSRLSAAQTKLKGAAKAMGDQTIRTRELRDGLRAAGVQTNDLAGAQSRLVATVERSRNAMATATAAVKKFGVAKQGVTDKIKLFNTGERTTLSYMQRMRGEVLALATSYVGLNAAAVGTREVLNVVRDMTKIDARFVAVFAGDAAKAREETDYLRAATNRIGVSFRDSALEYSKFISATNEAKWTVEETRFVFEQFAEAAVRTGQSKEEFKGIMLAITQMVSKGRIGAEELTQQLAERLPGAVAKLANELNISTADLLKRMENSAVSSRAVINLAQGMMKDNATAMISAGAEMIRAEGRLQTAKDDFALAVADAGFTKAYSEFLIELTALLSSDQGKQLAKTLGSALTRIVQLLGFLGENFESVRNILLAIVGLKAAAWVGSLAVAFKSLIVLVAGTVAPTAAALGLFRAMPLAAGGAATAVTALGTAVGFLGRMIPVLGALWIAWEVGSTILNTWTNSAKRAREEKEKLSGKSNASMAKSLGIDDIDKFGASTPNPGTQVTSGQMAATDIQAELAKEQKKLDAESQAARAKNAKDSLAQRQAIATEELVAMRERASKEITDEKLKGETLAIIDKQIAQKRLNEQIKFNNEHAGGVRTRANREMALIDEIAREMAAVEDRLKERETKIDPTASFAQRMRARMDLIAHEYDALLVKIGKLEKLDPKAATGLRGKVEAFVKQRQEVEAIKVKTEELQRLEKNLADTQALRSQKLEEVQALFEAGVITQDQLRQKIADTNDVFGLGIDKATDSLRAFAEQIRDILDPAAYELLVSKINTAAAQNQPGKANAQASIGDAETQLNDSLERRKILLDEIAQKQGLGIISQAEAARQTELVNSLFKQQIIDQTNALLVLIEVMRASIQPSNSAALLALDQMAAKVRGVRLEAEGVRQVFISFEDTVIQSAVGALESSLEGIVDIFGEILTGQKKVSEGAKDMARQAALSFAKMLRDAALYIIKLKIIEALKGSGNPALMAIGTAMEGGMGKKHTGGRAGSPSGSTSRYSIVAPTAIPRLHSGGIAGLNNNEVMRVLEKNEEVVTRNDPRHMLNGGTQAAQRSQRFVLVDERSRVPEAMASAEGDEVNMVWLRRNKATVKQILGN